MVQASQTSTRNTLPSPIHRPSDQEKGANRYPPRYTRPSPLTRVQFAPQVSILASLTSLLQRPSSPYTLNTRIRKVVQVGHSFGAFVSAAVLATTPTTPPTNAGDALILTGFSGRFDWITPVVAGLQPRVAALQFPDKWGRLPHGYLVPTDEYAVVYAGFKSPGFDRRAADWLYSHQSPYAIAEAPTSGLWPLDFGLVTVPVQVCLPFHDLSPVGGRGLLLTHFGARWFKGSMTFRRVGVTVMACWMAQLVCLRAREKWWSTVSLMEGIT